VPDAEPLVTIGVPTFQRREKLPRAVQSALRQTHRNIEVTVYDNASTDGTEELVRELARQDERLRYVRRERNLGPEANMDDAIRRGGAEFTMLLADDDWIADDYVQRCVAELLARPELSVAAGRPHYMRDESEVPFGAPIETLDPDPARRVLAYFSAVDDNAPFYGVIRRSAVEAQPAMRRVLGFDWLWVAGLAFTGGIARVEDAALFRELGGASESTEANIRTSGLPRAHAKIPHLVIGREVFAEIGWRSPVYAALGRGDRLRLAARCAWSVPRRNARHVAFHLLPARVQPWVSQKVHR
jgi:glycosyltransferase involved in cell wall biosynthesis